MYSCIRAQYRSIMAGRLGTCLLDCHLVLVLLLHASVAEDPTDAAEPPVHVPTRTVRENRFQLAGIDLLQITVVMLDLWAVAWL